MRFAYCPVCGTKTVLRQMGDDGDVPYCEACQKPLFDMFSTCVLTVAYNAAGEMALIRQSYGQQEFFVGVAGYMKPGETAEEAAAREVREEIGLSVDTPKFLFSAWHAARGQLMLCFRARAHSSGFRLSQEVSEAKWFTPETAMQAVRSGSIIERVVYSTAALMKKT